jgi:hypothetical protein
MKRHGEREPAQALMETDESEHMVEVPMKKGRCS